MPETPPPPAIQWFTARDAQGRVMSELDVDAFKADHGFTDADFLYNINEGQAVVGIRAGVVYSTLVFRRKVTPDPPTPAESAAFVAAQITNDQNTRRLITLALLNLARRHG